MGNVTSRDAATAEKMVSEFVGGLGLHGGTEIYPATFTEALARKGIECLEHMADDMIREADEHKKGFLTVDELKGAIVKASRLKRLLRAITHRWKHDSNYQACTSREVEGNYTNIEQDVDMCGLSFVMTVERGKLDNADTRRRAPRMKRYTWSGLPILEEDDFQRVRAKTVKSRQLHDSLQTPHEEVRFRRLPLHFCCANQLHPEAAVMVRDVLAASERGAQITDHEGRLPLHVACMNESYMSASMVRLLLRAYPHAAQVRDDFGYLPLHLCLQHNHGDAAFEIVDTLLDVYPHAARASSAQLHAGDMAIHLSLDNTSVFAHKIISRLLAVYPEALVQRGNAGLTLLHRFCWISHPCPFEVQKTLEARGICNLLRAPPLQKPGTHTKWDPPAHTITPGLPHTPRVWSERYCAVKKMKAILRSAKHYFPHCLNTLDHHGALPIHYLCQMGGPCSQGLLRALIVLHPHSLHVQDNKGNLPFHLAIGCEQPELAEILAHFASSQHSISRLGVPNHRDQLPSQVAGAWKVRQLFKLDSHFDFANNVMQSLLSPAIAVLSALLAWHYWQLHHVGYTCFLLAPFAIQAALCLALDIHELSSATNSDARSVARLVALTLLQWLQLRISFVSLVTTLKGRASSRWLLLVKRIEMAIVALPLATFNVIRLLDAPFGKEGGGGGGGGASLTQLLQWDLGWAGVLWLFWGYFGTGPA